MKIRRCIGAMTVATCLLAGWAHGTAQDTTWQELMNLERDTGVCVLKGIQLGEARSVDLALEPFTAMADDGVIVVEGADGRQFIDHEDLVHTYRGTIVGDEETLVFVSVTNSKLNGFISSEDGLYWMATDRANPEDELTLYVTDASEYDVPELPAGVEFCGVVADTIESGKRMRLGGNRSSGVGCVVVEIAYESDYEYTTTVFDGDWNASAAYMVALGSAVSTIMYSEINVKLAINYARTWRDDNDPYDPNNGIDMLDQFRDHWQGSMGNVDRDVAHILSGRDNLPYLGVAFGSTLCSYAWGYSVSGFLNGSFPTPLQDNNGGNYDLLVQAHELGHNLGAPHTHDIGVDNCVGGECDDATNATIMSYCHFCEGGFANMRLAYHPDIESYMFGYMNTVSCDEPGASTTALDDSFGTGVNQPVECDVLLNDQGASCDADLVAIGSWDTTSTQGGSIELVPVSGDMPREQLLYTPPIGFTSFDTFTYQLATGESATVIIDIGDSSDVLLVPATYPTIQQAIDAATDGDEIIVSPGIYTGDGEYVARTNGKAVYLHSSDGPEVTILDGELQRPVIDLLYSEDQATVVQGFTIIRGYAAAGGGVRCDGTPVIIDCIIRDNLSLGLAAGMLSTDLSGPRLQDVVFCNNTVALNPCAHVYGSFENVDETCEFEGQCSCPGDVNGDNRTGVDDLLPVLQVWGQDCLGCGEDRNIDGVVGVEDLLDVIEGWGDCEQVNCP